MPTTLDKAATALARHLAELGGEERSGIVSSSWWTATVYPMNTTPSGWWVYVRISSDPLGLRAGVENQRGECIALAESEGLPVAGVLEDNDRSAYKGKRPAYQQLLAYLDAGAAGVICWHNDRLHRSPKELESFIDVVERTGAGVMMVQGGTYDLTTPTGRLGARIVGATARYESEHKAERARLRHNAAAAAGRPAGGQRPFGYYVMPMINGRSRDTFEWTVNEFEAGLIREAARRVLEDGASVRSIVTDWNGKGIPTVKGGPWKVQGVKRVLTSARIAGLRTHNGKETPAAWGPIVDLATLEELRAVLNDPNRTTYAGPNARRYLLVGLVYCGTCGSKMFARPRPDGTRSYICAEKVAGHQQKIMAGPLEDLVRDGVIEALTSPMVHDAIDQEVEQGEDRRALAAELRSIEQRLLNAEQDHYVEATITKDAYKRIRAGLEAKRADLMGRLSEVRGHRVLGGLPDTAHALLARWEGDDLAWRREVVGLVVERITVHPGRRGYNRFDPTRVKVTLRDGTEDQPG